MTLHRLVAVSSIAIASSAVSTPSPAQEGGRDVTPTTSQDGTDKKVAKENFQAGAKAYRNKDFLVAARAFEVAHRLAPHPYAVYNAGVAWDDGGRPGRAADDLEEALAMGELEPDMVEDAQKRLARLRKAVGVVSIIAPRGTKLDLGHVAAGELPRQVHLPPGVYTARVVHADGEMQERELTVEAAGTAELVFEASKPEPAPEPPPTLLGPTGPEPASPMPYYVGGGVALGIGVLAGAAAIGLGVTALSARDDFVQSGNTDPDSRDQASTLRTVTNVTWIVAGVGTVTGVTLFTVGAVSTGGDEVEAELQASPTGVVLRGRF